MVKDYSLELENCTFVFDSQTTEMFCKRVQSKWSISMKCIEVWKAIKSIFLFVREKENVNEAI